MLARTSILALSILPAVCHAEWVSSEIKDEMRSSSTKIYTQEASPINGSGPELTIRVFDKGDGAPSVVLDLSKGRVDGCPEQGERTCKIEVRFGDGPVGKHMFATDDGKQFVPTKMGEFFGAIYHGDRLFLELDVDKYPYQYKFPLASLPTKFNKKPDIEILGFKIGYLYERERPVLEKNISSGDRECFLGSVVPGVFEGVKVNKVSMCFYKGVFYQAIITPGSQAAYRAGYSLLTKAFGKPDPESIFPRWPDNKGFLIDRHIRSATYVTPDKDDYKAPFVISDESWSILVPDPN